MKTFTIELSDDAAGMLDEIRTVYDVKPENVIRVCFESAMADSLHDDLGECFGPAARDPDAAAAECWEAAYELFEYYK